MNIIRLPGKAYAKGQHVWLTGANEVDSRVFSRAILAKVLLITLLNLLKKHKYSTNINKLDNTII